MIIKSYGRTYSTWVYLAVVCSVIFVVTIVLVLQRQPNLDLIRIMVDWSWRALVTLLIGGGVIAARSAVEDFKPVAPTAPSGPGKEAAGP